MNLREGGKSPGLVEQEALGILNTALKQQQAISYVFDLKDDPLGLGQYGNSMLNFFLLRNIAFSIRHSAPLNAHVSESPEELSNTLDRLLRNKEPKLPDKVANSDGLGLILEPVQKIAGRLADMYPFKLPLTDEEKREDIASLKDLADDYRELVRKYGLKTLIQRPLVEKSDKVFIGGLFVLAALAVLFGSKIFTPSGEEEENSSPKAPTVSPRPLGVVPHTNGHSIEPKEIPTSQPTEPEYSNDYVTYAESLLSRPIPGATELNPPSHRESLDKIMGLKIGKPEKIKEDGWEAKAGKNGVRIVNLPAPLPSPEKIEEGQEVRGLAEIQTEDLDGTVYVYWLLFGKINSQPRYAHIATINPDNSVILHIDIDSIPEDYFPDK